MEEFDVEEYIKAQDEWIENVEFGKGDEFMILDQPTVGNWRRVPDEWVGKTVTISKLAFQDAVEGRTLGIRVHRYGDYHILPFWCLAKNKNK